MFETILKWLRGTDRSTRDIPDTLWQSVEHGLPFLTHLSAGERAKLRELTMAFLGAKQFHGAQGLVLTDEIMLSIAVQACLPILNIGLAAYDDWVGIIVYPGDFIVPRHETDEDGVVHEYDDTVLGEAWEQGPVLLSWQDTDALPAGMNVVIHEFAHKLDMSNGGADGFPPLPAHMDRQTWSIVFEEAYETLCEQVDRGQTTALDPYAAEHPAEFFAVASEAFFETPAVLQDAFPAVYQQLSAFYGLDPAPLASS